MQNIIGQLMKIVVGAEVVMSFNAILRLIDTYSIGENYNHHCMLYVLAVCSTK